MSKKTAVIIGAGPAGLTAAFELLNRTDVRPIVLEKSAYMGGISKTVNYKGNRIDIGGHRFFSRSERVMSWWMARMPLQQLPGPQTVTYHRMQAQAPAGSADPERTDRVMLVRPRKSRIYYMRRFFEYPITLSVDTIRKLGLFRTCLIGLSYLKSALFPIRNERSLEEFFINRFGRRLYLTFFKSYTEKVWGVPCKEISAEWGAQRVKGLSIWKTIQHAVKKAFGSRRSGDISQKGTETSLIEQFMYPKLGPGQMWETVAQEVKELGGRIVTDLNVDRIHMEGNRVRSIEATNSATGERAVFEGDYFFSTMPIRELIRAITPAPPASVREVSDGLVYRDFITVGLLVRDMKVKDRTEQGARLVRDNWIYIQEPDVQVGRLQVFNNWSPYLVADPNTIWLGLEYFCNDTDALWKMKDADLIALAEEELRRIDILDAGSVLDGTVLRVEKTYPAYFGSYDRFQEIRDYVDGLENLFLVGRNGMHKYNNQDHSMLTAMVAVDNIAEGRTDKSNIWAVNTEQEYHEEKTEQKAPAAATA